MQSAEIGNFFHRLSDLAAEETLPHFRRTKAIDNKLTQGFDPVTEADRGTELALRNAVMEQFPDHGIIGEEFDHHQPDAEYRWIIDPIDGTKAFITGLPLWGTLVALYHFEKPVAGMMYQPFTGEKFIGNGGVSTLSRGDQTENLKVSAAETLNDAILMSTSPDFFKKDELVKFEHTADQCKLTRFGGDCYAYCMLAAGQVDLVIEAGLNLYDIAALIPIIEGAGGTITDWQGNAAPPGGQIVAAATPQLHREALTALNSI